MKPTTLYRFFCADGLLYVGISLSVLDRWRNHRENQPWWGAVTRATMEHFSTREEAASAELAAIRKENPRYNKAGRITRSVKVRRSVQPPLAREERTNGPFLILGQGPVAHPPKEYSPDTDWSSLPLEEVALLIAIDKESR